MSTVLNVFLHSSRQPPSLTKLAKERGNGTYAILTKIDTGYRCTVVMVEDGTRKLERTLKDNSLGGYLITLTDFQQKGINVRGVLYRGDSIAGINRALAKTHPKPIIVSQAIA
jgi:hypothetical protein